HGPHPHPRPRALRHRWVRSGDQEHPARGADEHGDDAVQLAHRPVVVRPAGPRRLPQERPGRRLHDPRAGRLASHVVLQVAARQPGAGRALDGGPPARRRPRALARPGQHALQDARVRRERPAPPLQLRHRDAPRPQHGRDPEHRPDGVPHRRRRLRQRRREPLRRDRRLGHDHPGRRAPHVPVRPPRQLRRGPPPHGRPAAQRAHRAPPGPEQQQAGHRALHGGRLGPPLLRHPRDARLGQRRAHRQHGARRVPHDGRRRPALHRRQDGVGRLRRRRRHRRRHRLVEHPSVPLPVSLPSRSRRPNPNPNQNQSA
ncbi:expressed protein, partial [Aureococcus anophagefferens]